ncbi:MAG: CPBP family intramembrane metalloprotease [Burkholderiaceae bacterium]|nr:CPBP family intramembrane metalloprotease [Burkholderiaceae bacterium]
MTALQRWLKWIPTERDLEALTIRFYAERAFESRLDDLKVALAVGVMGGVAAAISVPHLLEVMPMRADAPQVAREVFAISHGLQAAFLTSLLAFLGIRMGHTTGLGAPLLQGVFNQRQPYKFEKSGFVDSALMGALIAAVSILVLVLAGRYIVAQIDVHAATGADISSFNAFLGSFYSAISAEVQFRLFLLTLLVWVATRFSSKPARSWFFVAALTAALLSAVANGLVAERVGDDIMPLLGPALLDLIGGLAFGWLYCKRGLEMAIVAHLSADLVTYVLFPVLLSWSG